MADSSGYEYINEELINKFLKCSICTKPFIDPLSTKCDAKSHTFCRHCIEERIRNNASCPMCDQDLHMQDLTPMTHGITKDMLDQISVKCLMCEQSDVKRGCFDVHRQEMCPKVVVVCPASDLRCPWVGPRDQVNEHTNVCVFYLLKPLLNKLQNDNQQLKDQLDQQLTNGTNQQLDVRLEQLNERLQTLELMSIAPLVCKGHPCLKCKRCSDWYHDGKNWTRRSGYTCNDYVAPDRDSEVSGFNRHVGGFFGIGDVLCQCEK